MQTVDHKIIACPLCGAKEYRDMYQMDFRIWTQGNREWRAHQVVCIGCGFIYTNPRPSEEALKDFYDAYLRFGPIDSFFRGKQIDFLCRNAPNAGRTLLDIGAFNGSFLDLARQKGFEVHGIEPTAEGVAEARGKGLDVVQGFFNTAYANSLKERYDVVTMLHTLEHVEDPLTFVRLALQVTVPGGYLYIEVPDVTRAFAESINDFFSVQHLNHFTSSTLKNLASRAGATVVVVEQEKELGIVRILIKNAPGAAPLINEYESNMCIMRAYKERKEIFLDNLRKKIQVKEVSLYGAGEHSSQLLSSDLLKGIRVAAITDSNPKKWGMPFHGFTVIPPAELPNVPILISSYDSQEDITSYLTKHFPHLSQLKLYDRIISYDTGNEL